MLMKKSVLPKPAKPVLNYFSLLSKNEKFPAEIISRLKNDYRKEGIVAVSEAKFQQGGKECGEPFIDIRDAKINPENSRIQVMPKHLKEKSGLPEPELGAYMRIGTYHALQRMVSYLPEHV
jgi:hypothetical protein